MSSYIRALEICDRIHKQRAATAEMLWSQAFGDAMPPSNCVHNASLDSELRGWCSTRAQLRAATRCNELLCLRPELKILDRIAQRSIR